MGTTVTAARMRQKRLGLANTRRDLEDVPEMVDLLNQLEPTGIPVLSAFLGLTDGSRPLLLRLTAPTLGHVLIVADDKESRTGLLRALVLSLTLTNPQRQLQAAILDMKGMMGSLVDLPHLLTPVIGESETALDLLVYLLALLDQRRGVGTEPHIVLVVDELADWGGETLSLLGRLQERGAEAGIHLVCSTSRPAEVDWGMIDSSCFTKLLGAMVDATVMSLRKDELAALDPGEYLAIAAGEKVAFQAVQLAERQARELVRAMWEKPYYHQWLEDEQPPGRLLRVIK